MELRRESKPLHPELDIGLTEQMLRSVAKGQLPATVRLFVPGPTVAFGRMDRLLAGFDAASQAALDHGYTPVVRLAGGHAVIYDGGSVIFEVIRPESKLYGGLEARFTETVDLILEALAQLGVTLEVGELPDEYCPGRFSAHLPDGPKIVGLAQRVISGASLTAAVISVGVTDAQRELTSEIYSALDLELDPRTVGSIADRHKAIEPEAVIEALASRIGM